MSQQQCLSLHCNKDAASEKSTECAGVRLGVQGRSAFLRDGKGTSAALLSVHKMRGTGLLLLLPSRIKSSSSY